jgi:hypothetical protein
MSKWRRLQKPALDFRGIISESHCCTDCGYNTNPSQPTREEAEREAARQIRAGKRKWKIPTRYDHRSEVFIVHDHIWKAAGMEPWGGCLCVGCLEARIGRELRPEDFPPHPFLYLPGTPRLLERQGRLAPPGELEWAIKARDADAAIDERDGWGAA